MIKNILLAIVVIFGFFASSAVCLAGTQPNILYLIEINKLAPNDSRWKTLFSRHDNAWPDLPITGKVNNLNPSKYAQFFKTLEANNIPRCQIDFECPKQELKQYAKLLHRIKQAHPKIELSIVVEQRWLFSLYFGDLLPEIDSFMARLDPSAVTDYPIVNINEEKIKSVASLCAIFKMPYYLLVPPRKNRPDQFEEDRLSLFQDMVNQLRKISGDLKEQSCSGFALEAGLGSINNLLLSDQVAIREPQNSPFFVRLVKLDRSDYAVYLLSSPETACYKKVYFDLFCAANTVDRVRTIKGFKVNEVLARPGVLRITGRPGGPLKKKLVARIVVNSHKNTSILKLSKVFLGAN